MGIAASADGICGVIDRHFDVRRWHLWADRWRTWRLRVATRFQFMDTQAYLPPVKYSVISSWLGTGSGRSSSPR